MIRLKGFSFETADDADVDARKSIRNLLFKWVGTGSLVLHFHIVRRRQDTVFEDSPAIDPNIQISEDFENDASLDDFKKGRLRGMKNELFRYLVRQYEIREDQERILAETKDILKRVMNPASHSTFTPLYEEELKTAIEGVKKLKEVLEADALT